jgi:hypothetical protein
MRGLSVTDGVSLRLLEEVDAQELHALIEANRTRLSLAGDGSAGGSGTDRRTGSGAGRGTCRERGQVGAIDDFVPAMKAPPALPPGHSGLDLIAERLAAAGTSPAMGRCDFEYASLPRRRSLGQPDRAARKLSGDVGESQLTVTGRIPRMEYLRCAASLACESS